MYKIIQNNFFHLSKGFSIFRTTDKNSWLKHPYESKKFHKILSGRLFKK
jgi:hypothetical protein